MNFDILIASYERASILQRCLACLEQQSTSHLNKVIVLINEQDAKSIEVLNSFREIPVEVVKTAKKLRPGASRNLLIKKSTAEYVCFIDDDTSPPLNYLATAVEIMKKYNPNIFGGPDRSCNEEGLKQEIIGELLASPLVMGPTSVRHSQCSTMNLDSDETSLTLCNIWIKRELFESLNVYFDESLKRCEENKLLAEFHQKNIKMSYFPELYVNHLRRESIFQIAKIQFLSGFYRSLVFYKQKACFRSFFIIPALTGLLILSFVFLPTKVQILLVTTHIILSWIVSFKIVLKKLKIETFLYSWLVMTTIHVCFSVGMFIGIILGVLYAREDSV